MENLLRQAGIIPRFEKGQDPSLHPAKQAGIYLEGQKIGAVGEVHPRVLSAFEILEPVYLWDTDLKTLAPFTLIEKKYQPIPRFPAIVRDMALIADTGVTHQNVRKVIQGFPLVERVDIFDVYAGEQLPADKKSLAYRIRYLSLTHTLTDEEVNQVQQQILERLNIELGLVLRG